MLKIIDRAEEIAAFLDSQKSEIVIDFRILVKLSMELDVKIIVPQRGSVIPLLVDKFPGVGDNTQMSEILPLELEEDRYLTWLFSGDSEKKIDFGSRRRFNNLIDFVNHNEQSGKPAIATFYSYKGGMGRSTTLASFASYCAKLLNKRVVIIDSDFEAPGFTNYFDISEEVMAHKSGVVEYLMDREFLQSTEERLDIQADYCYKVGFEYVGHGEIYVVPAGNLTNSSNLPAGFAQRKKIFNSIHRTQYLEALSRLDISSSNNIISQIQDFVADVTDQINPDIILFDSRTGFNDIFAALAGLSNVIVGFFGNNIQNKTGLEQFLDSFGSISANKDIVLVNSIIPGMEYFEDFKRNVEQYIDENQDRFVNSDANYSSLKNFKMHYVKRDEILQRVGTDFAFRKSGLDQSYDVNFVNLIEQNSFFQPFFEDLVKSLEQHVSTDQVTVEVIDKQVQDQHLSGETTNDIVLTIQEKDLGLFLDDNNGKVVVWNLRRSLLEKLKQNMPSRYGEDEIPEISDVYFRDWMKDIFNRDKFLIIGSKGTGKTFLYQAFKNHELRNKLQERANIFSDKYLFVNVVSVHNEDSPNRYLEATQFNIPEIPDTDYFFSRFWVIYLWNALMLDEGIRESKYYSSNIIAEPITLDPLTVRRFRNLINDDEAYEKVFEELKILDNKLKADDKNLIVLFEQLDFIVKPEYWPEAISPLINFWRSNPFSKILPKLFLRSDLFGKLTNITNVQSLANRAIDIEWTKQELFAYFFKLIFQHSKEEFYLLIFAHFGYRLRDFILEIESVASANDNQVPTDDRFLKPLVEVFFGKFANWHDVTVNDGFGESYDWFERNLRDANDKISIRPFLNLIEKAIDLFLSRPATGKNIKSILSASFFADSTVREFAVQQHYEDLAREKGNRALQKFYQYITVDGPTRLKIPVFRRTEFNEVLNHIITKYKDDADLAETRNVNDLKFLLTSNGIIKETDNNNRVYTNYSIPFLYRKFFRVSSQNRIDGRTRT